MSKRVSVDYSERGHAPLSGRGSGFQSEAGMNHVKSRNLSPAHVFYIYDVKRVVFVM